MSVIMYVDFPHQDVWGDEMASQMSELAESIMSEPGCIWKIWTENKLDQTAGGVYLFDTRSNAENYLLKHTERLTKWGYKAIRGRVFEVNKELSTIDKGPI
ncbi:monooxygenase [Aquimarina sp. 2201CG5-10]|uniref:monooxygenase n=1 Tax=Aquimarina callyspongiae TaxID=3098150 RepID=UPI002AB5404E|nr:monooxygenase [Aquimarina sp. 2201CG5-10]MDY8138041.1 monooxygenase [Aquimarina sp. 2201CG5-10]